MELFGVGPLEALLVGVIAFILVGPDRFPELARQAGKWYRVARAFTADVMEDVQGAVKEIEAEVDATTGGGLRSIRELTDSSTGLLSEARADLEAATSSAQAAMQSTDATTAATTETPVAESESATPEPVATAEAPSEVAPSLAEVAPTEPVPAAFTSMPPAQSPDAAYGDPFEAAEAKRREAAAREAAARLTGGGA